MWEKENADVRGWIGGARCGGEVGREVGLIPAGAGAPKQEGLGEEGHDADE